MSEIDLQGRRERIRAKYGVAEADAGRASSSEPLVEAAAEHDYYANQWQLMWWRFRRHKMALLSIFLLLLLYLIAAFADFVAPYDATQRFRRYQQAPPTQIHWFDENGLRRPFVYGVAQERNPVTRRVTFC